MTKLDISCPVCHETDKLAIVDLVLQNRCVGVVAAKTLFAVDEDIQLFSQEGSERLHCRRCHVEWALPCEAKLDYGWPSPEEIKALEDADKPAEPEPEPNPFEQIEHDPELIQRWGELTTRAVTMALVSAVRAAHVSDDVAVGLRAIHLNNTVPCCSVLDSKYLLPFRFDTHETFSLEALKEAASAWLETK
jgi:hypothetical protein